MEQRIFTPDQERAAKILKGILEVHDKMIGFNFPMQAQADIIDYFADEFAEIRKGPHAAEQPKLTEATQEFATEFLVFAKFAFGEGRNAWPMSVYHLAEMADALLTSPVAPPPQQTICENCGKGIQICFEGKSCGFRGWNHIGTSSHYCNGDYSTDTATPPPPVAPGEQPPRIIEEETGPRIPSIMSAIAPPAQERASDERRAEEWREAHLVHRKLLPAIAELIAETRATAAKQAREKAVRWLLYVGGVDHETLADILAENTSAADGDVAVEAEFADLERSVLAAKATLAAQPSPQMPQKER